jgi:hypothetical protein
MFFEMNLIKLLFENHGGKKEIVKTDVQIRPQVVHIE